jgi:hypothetical protein
MTRGGSPDFGLEVWLTTPHCQKNKLVMKKFAETWTWMHSLDKGPM